MITVLLGPYSQLRTTLEELAQSTITDASRLRRMIRDLQRRTVQVLSETIEAAPTTEARSMTTTTPGFARPSDGDQPLEEERGEQPVSSSAQAEGELRQAEQAAPRFEVDGPGDRLTEESVMPGSDEATEKEQVDVLSTDCEDDEMLGFDDD